MNLLTVLYVILVIAGIAWVVYRLRIYLSRQKERETRWIEMASEDELRSYVKDLKTTTPANSRGSKQPSAAGSPRPKGRHSASKAQDGVVQPKK